MLPKKSREAATSNESPGSVTSGENPELTEAQLEAGREIAEHCGFGADILEQPMTWGGTDATVGYGLAHSAHHMDDLTPEEIRQAVANGILDYQKTHPNNPDQAL